MNTFKLWAIRIPVEYINKLKEIKKEKHISCAESIRIALRDYFEKISK